MEKIDGVQKVPYSSPEMGVLPEMFRTRQRHQQSICDSTRYKDCGQEAM